MGRASEWQLELQTILAFLPHTQPHGNLKMSSRRGPWRMK